MLKTLFCMVESLQAICVIAYIYHFIPITWEAPIPKGLEPERESFLFLCWIVINVAMMFLINILTRNKSTDNVFQRSLLRLLIVEIGWLLLMIFAFFKWVTYQYGFYNIYIYQNILWIEPFFYGVVMGSVMTKVFWPEISRLIQKVPVYQSIWMDGFLQAGTIIFIILSLWVVDYRTVIALNLAWDRFVRMDHWIAVGVKTYEDVITVSILIMMGIFIGLFYFIKNWLKSIWLSCFAVLVSMNMMLFHPGVGAIWIPPILPDFHLIIWGMENYPLYKPLQVRQFFVFFMQFIILLIFAYTLCIAIIQWHDKSKRLVGVIAACGLLLSVVFIAQPLVGAYGIVAVLLMMVICFWIKQFGKLFPAAWSNRVIILITGISFLMLLTNRLFLVYPNIFHHHPKRYYQEVQMLEKHFDLQSQAALIQQLIPIDQGVVLVSSFESAILQKAKRKSLLAQSPLILSSLNGQIRGLRFKRLVDLNKIYAQIRRYQPEYVFVEATIWNIHQVKAVNAGLKDLIIFINSYYKPIKQQAGLIVLQRK